MEEVVVVGCLAWRSVRPTLFMVEYSCAEPEPDTTSTRKQLMGGGFAQRAGLQREAKADCPEGAKSSALAPHFAWKQSYSITGLFGSVWMDGYFDRENDLGPWAAGRRMPRQPPLPIYPLHVCP